MDSIYDVTDNSLKLRVRVTPNSAKSEFAGRFDSSLKIKIKAKPVDGAANKELIKFLSKSFRMAKSSLEIIGGIQNREKTVMIRCGDTQTLERIRNAIVKAL